MVNLEINSKKYYINKFNFIIRHLNFVFETNNKMDQAVKEQINRIMRETESESTHELAKSLNSDLIFESYIPYYLKYYGKPWKYIKECNKRKDFSLWN
mgnify:CR=1 FL=1|tara:strand:- start:356 stop:649 length:294 start_codon:yes stop_codon:yes gene_type:complete